MGRRERPVREEAEALTTRYVSGRSFEYRVKAYLEKRGYKVVRSAGSHGPIDLLAGKSLIDRSRWTALHAHVALAVQCKHNQSRFGPEDADELREWADAFGAIPILCHNDGRRLITSRVEKTGLRPIAV